MEETVGPVSTCGRELLWGWWSPIGLMVSFMFFTSSVWKLLDQPMYMYICIYVYVYNSAPTNCTTVYPHAGVDIQYIFSSCRMNSVIQKVAIKKSHHFILSTVPFWSSAASGMQWLLSIISQHSVWFSDILISYHTGAFLFLWTSFLVSHSLGICWQCSAAVQKYVPLAVSGKPLSVWVDYHSSNIVQKSNCLTHT